MYMQLIIDQPLTDSLHKNDKSTNKPSKLPMPIIIILNELANNILANCLGLKMSQH